LPSLKLFTRGLYIEKYPPPPPEGKISAYIIWGKIYEKAKRKRGKMEKNKEERGKKRRKGKENEKWRSKRVK
jgi:hypothetical protein